MPTRKPLHLCHSRLRPGRGSGLHIASALALGAVLLAAVTRPAGAIVTRTEEQRLVWDNEQEIPEGSHLGARLDLMTQDSSDFRRAFISAPDGAGMGVFHLSDGGTWQHLGAVTGNPQPFAVDRDSSGAGGLYASLDSDGTYRVHNATGELILPPLDDEVGALALRGNFLAVGQPGYATGHGRLLLYELVAGTWQPVASFLGDPFERLGSSLAAVDSILVAGAPTSGPNGAVYIYLRGSEWTEWQRIESPAISQTAARFGEAVAIEGDYLAVGSPYVDRVTTPGEAVDIGAVYLYVPNFLMWELSTLIRPIEASDDDHFGASVSLYDPLLVAGSPGEDGASLDEGAAYVYQRSGTQWQKRLRLVDSDTETGAALGAAVAVGDRGALVGAPGYDGNDIFDQGAALYFRDLVTLFADGFESGDTSEWSSTTP